MVVDDVQVDLQPGLVEGGHHLLELARRPAQRLVVGVFAVGGEERQGHVTPRVRVSLARGFGLVGLVDGQQFQGGDTEGLQVGRHHPDAPVGAQVFLGYVHHVLETRFPAEQRAEFNDGGVPDQLRDRGLVDGGLLAGQLRFGEGRAGGSQDHTLGGDVSGVGLAAGRAPVVVRAGAEGAAVEPGLQDCVGVDGVGDLPGVGVEHHLVGVETVAVLVDVGDETG